jgi:desulfoferrodoxin (superoxide reductase-like protein)
LSFYFFAKPQRVDKKIEKHVVCIIISKFIIFDDVNFQINSINLMLMIPLAQDINHFLMTITIAKKTNFLQKKAFFTQRNKKLMFLLMSHVVKKL